MPERNATLQSHTRDYGEWQENGRRKIIPRDTHDQNMCFTNSFLSIRVKKGWANIHRNGLPFFGLS